MIYQDVKNIKADFNSAAFAPLITVGFYCGFSLVCVFSSFLISNQADALEMPNTREYVKRCRERGKADGITQRNELRDFIRECVEDMRETQIQPKAKSADKENAGNQGVIDIVVVESNEGTFDGEEITSND